MASTYPVPLSRGGGCASGVRCLSCESGVQVETGPNPQRTWRSKPAILW